MVLQTELDDQIRSYDFWRYKNCVYVFVHHA